MSNALTPEAPETDSAAPSVEDIAPVDGTAVADGSAGDAEAKVVDAARFNGLMSAHQRVLNELEAERTARAELEARITSQETYEVADEAIAARLDRMEERAIKAEREAAVQRAVAKYPDAAPFADLFVGTDPDDIENVAAAVAQRAATLKGPAQEPAPEPEAPAAAPEAPAAEAPEAPVIGGGHAAPTTPSTSDAVKAALDANDWSAYWKAKTGPAAQANLG